MAVDPTRALRRTIGVAKLDIPTIEEVEADTSSTTEAGVVVIVTSLIGSLGSLFTGGLWGFIVTLIVLIAGWYIWAFVAAFIAQNVFKVQTTDVGEMQRVIGYASGPRVLGLIPFMGLVSFIWSVVAFVVGIRQAGEMTTGQAVLTALLGLIPVAIAMAIVTAILL